MSVSADAQSRAPPPPSEQAQLIHGSPGSSRGTGPCRRPGNASAPNEPNPTTHPFYSPLPRHPPHHLPGSRQQAACTGITACGSPGLKANRARLFLVLGEDGVLAWDTVVPSSVPALLAQSVGPEPCCSGGPCRVAGACPLWMPLTHLHVLSEGPIPFP